MFLSDSAAIRHHIKELLQDTHEPYCVAVAFWGKGAETLVPGNRHGKIVCNLLHPGTNPFVIEQIRSLETVSIRSLATLHAKVVVSDTGTFVGSANFSDSALGITAGGSTWSEAGVLLKPCSIEATQARRWFDDVWSIAQEIDDAHLADAKARWALCRLQDDPYLNDLNLPALADLSAADPLDEPQLRELDLFAQAIEKDIGRDAMTMPSKRFQAIYDELMGLATLEPGEGQPKGRNRQAAGQAANLLWAQSGKQSTLKIGGVIQQEVSPRDFLDRAISRGTYPDVALFLRRLSESDLPCVDFVYRFWAQRVIQAHGLQF